GLEPNQREAYVMLELEQMTAREASTLCGVNANTLSARLRAVRLRLRDSLASEQAPMSPAALVQQERRPEAAPARSRQRVLAGLLPLWPASRPELAAASSPASSSGVISLKVWFAASALVVTTLAVDSTRAAGSPPPQIVSEQALASTPARPRIPLAPPEAAPSPPPVELLPVEPPPIEPPPASVGDPMPARVTPPAPVPAPRTAPASSSPPKPRTRKRPRAPEPAAGDLAAQTELAGRVFAASDPHEVLRLVDDYRDRFGRGFYGDRLAVHEIAALCGLGRTSRAQRQLGRLERRSAPLAEQARRRCNWATADQPR
ncbi:MAG: sigma factor-like helix-turn-helix DNA-binding protein, partial [Myxococcota bacterium]